MKKIKDLFNSLDTLDLKIMKIGLKFCTIIVLISTLILSFYISLHNVFLFNFGISLFKLSTYLFIEFIICGIVVDKIKKTI